MEHYLLLYNPLSGNNTGEKSARIIGKKLDGEVVYQDLMQIGDYASFYAAIPPEQKIVLVGGDGTLNHFINLFDPDSIDRDVYYSGAGTGNDFLNDLGKKGLEKPFLLNPYLKGLPYVDISGHTYRFINGIGFGLDGYCCEEADRMKHRLNRPVSYTWVALKGLACCYKPTNAVITVDGVTRKFRSVWLAPTMHGRYFGGGMLPAPKQNRMNPDRTLTVIAMYRLGKLKALLNFPRMFRGTLEKFAGHSFFGVGHDITVTFDRPTAVQIDGEAIVGVLSYHAYTK